jgi:hypothetical protein
MARIAFTFAAFDDSRRSRVFAMGSDTGTRAAPVGRCSPLRYAAGRRSGTVHPIHSRPVQHQCERLELLGLSRL